MCAYSYTHIHRLYSALLSPQMLLEDLAKWWKYFIHVCIYMVKVIVDCSMAVTLTYIHIYLKSYMTWENQYKKNKASNYRWVRFMRK